MAFGRSLLLSTSRYLNLRCGGIALVLMKLKCAEVHKILSMLPKRLCGHAQLGPSLCDSLDCTLPGSSVHEISQARTLEWVTISYSRDLPNPEIKPVSLLSLALVGAVLTTAPPWKPILYWPFSILQTYQPCSRLRSFTRYSFFLKFSLH